MGERGGPTFVEGGVQMEIRGDHFHIWTDGTAYALPLSVARKLSRLCSTVIANHDARADNVVPLCELCTRHNLPRD